VAPPAGRNGQPEQGVRTFLSAVTFARDRTGTGTGTRTSHIGARSHPSRDHSSASAVCAGIGEQACLPPPSTASRVLFVTSVPFRLRFCFCHLKPLYSASYQAHRSHALRDVPKLTCGVKGVYSREKESINTIGKRPVILSFGLGSSILGRMLPAVLLHTILQQQVRYGSKVTPIT